jgi:ferric-dicitrate binding protein FerR (iron transport regulator)
MHQELSEFKALFNKWHEGNASVKESVQLMQMIASGRYAKEIEELSESTINSNDSGILVTHETLTQNYQAAQEQRKRIDQHIERAKRKFSFGRMAAIAATLVTLVVASLWMLNEPEKFTTISTETLTNKPATTTISGRRFVKLPDGTSVTLNTGGTLSYTSEFGKDLRSVRLEGEAFFDVAHDLKHPFVVQTKNDVNTTVLGTAFNIKAYKDQDKIVVTVVRGKVKVGNSTQEFGSLTPLQELSVSPSTMTFEKYSIASTEPAVAWKKSFLIMESLSMKEVAEKISERFSVEVIIVPEFADCKVVNLSFVNNEPLEDVLATIEDVAGAKYTQQDGTYTISGKCH